MEDDTRWKPFPEQQKIAAGQGQIDKRKDFQEPYSIPQKNEGIMLFNF